MEMVRSESLRSLHTTGSTGSIGACSLNFSEPWRHGGSRYMSLLCTSCVRCISHVA